MSEALVTLSPPTTLEFRLERGIQPQTILKVTNVSSSKIVFKVKTTQPSWYYVRPNQQMLDVGQTEDVTILLVDTECNRFLNQLDEGKVEKLDKHRFLVQSTIISQAEYSRIFKLPGPQHGEELSKVWDDNKNEKRNTRLRVAFQTPSLTSNLQSKTLSTGTASISLEDTKKSDISSSSTNANPEAIFAELQSLRKKFDAVVEYTVHLTAERDSIMLQLETAQKELKTQTEANNTSTGVKGKKEMKDKEEGEKNMIEGQGFSLLVVLLATLLAFIIGKYTG